MTVHHADVHAVFGPGRNHADAVGHMSHAAADVAPAAWTVELLPLKRLADALQLAVWPAAAVNILAMLERDGSRHQFSAYKGNRYID